MSNEISKCIVNVWTEMLSLFHLSEDSMCFGTGRCKWRTFNYKCSHFVERGSIELLSKIPCLREACKAFLKTVWKTFGVRTFLHISNGNVSDSQWRWPLPHECITYCLVKSMCTSCSLCGIISVHVWNTILKIIFTNKLLQYCIMLWYISKLVLSKRQYLMGGFLMSN